MRNDNYVFTIHYLGANCIIPVGHHSVSGHLERLRQRQMRRRQVVVASIMNWMSWVAYFKSWGRNVVAASPLSDLSLSELLCCFFFVQASQGAIVAFIQSPSFIVRDPQRVHFLSDVVISHNCTRQHGSVRYVKLISLFLQNFTSLDSFVDSLWRQLNIMPASELVFEIPLALTVANEDDSVQVF